MAHNQPPAGETVESRLATGLEMIKMGHYSPAHLNLGNYAMHLAIGDEGVQQLMSAVTSSDKLTMSKITLYGNHIGPAGAAAVADVIMDRPELRIVNLQTNTIGLQGARSLAAALESETCGLTKLCLGFTDIGDEGVIAIGKALVKNRSLTAINMPSCEISDKGAAWFAEALRDNHIITRLDLENNACVSAAVSHALGAACLINQKRIKAPWSQKTHWRFPKEFRMQVCTFVILAETASAASPVSQYLANLPHDLNVMLNQMLYDTQWHKGEKKEALKNVLCMLDPVPASTKPVVARRATRSSTRKAAQQDA